MLAHVVVKEGEALSSDEFFQFCLEKMAYYMAPKYLPVQEGVSQDGDNENTEVQIARGRADP